MLSIPASSPTSFLKLVRQLIRSVHLKPRWQCRSHRGRGFDPWVGKIPWRRKWQPTPVFLPRKFHGQRSLEGYSPWDCKESDMTEYTHTGVDQQGDRKRDKSLKRTKTRTQTESTIFLFFVNHSWSVVNVSNQYCYQYWNHDFDF